MGTILGTTSKKLLVSLFQRAEWAAASQKNARVNLPASLEAVVMGEIDGKESRLANPSG
jgi:hypothetical protein